MTAQDKPKPPLVITPTQAKYLREGFKSTKIGGILKVPELSERLQAILESDKFDTIPDELSESTQQLARLVLGAEITTVQTHIDTGRTGQLDARLGSDRGFISKYEVLKGIISIDQVDVTPVP